MLARQGVFGSINDRPVQVLADPSAMVGYDTRHYLFRQALRAGKFPNLWLPLGYAMGVAREPDYDASQQNKDAKPSTGPVRFIHQPGFTGKRQRLGRVILYGLTAPITPSHLYTVYSYKKEDAAAFPDGDHTGPNMLVSQICDKGFPFFRGHSSAPPKGDLQHTVGLTTTEYDTVTVGTLLDGLIKNPVQKHVGDELWDQMARRRYRAPTQALEYKPAKDKTQTGKAHRRRGKKATTDIQILEMIDGRPVAMETNHSPSPVGTPANPVLVRETDPDPDPDVDMGNGEHAGDFSFETPRIKQEKEEMVRTRTGRFTPSTPTTPANGPMTRGRHVQNDSLGRQVQNDSLP